MAKCFLDTNILIYANVALGKLNQAAEVVRRQIHLLEQIEVVHQSPAMIRRKARSIV